MLTEHLKSLAETITLPRRNIVLSKLALQIAQCASAIDEATEIDGAAFNALTIEMRKECLALLLGTIAESFGG